MTATRTKASASKNGKATTPIRRTGVFLTDSGDERNYINRLLIGTPSRGQVRIEWVAALRSIITPANWGNGWFSYVVDDAYPVRFTVAHAQNVIVKYMMESKPEFEWLLLYEDDMLPLPDLFIRLDKYLRDGPPIVSGLYYQKSIPPEPVIYRGRGNGAFLDWKPGQKVWVDGVPTGMLLIHQSILKLLYDESREYTVGGQTLREVFVSPMFAITDEHGNISSGSGTSDLEFCRRIIAEDVLKRAGWPRIARRKFPFLVDTSILVRHVAPDGTMYPP
jgi:hypothetical protein